MIASSSDLSTRLIYYLADPAFRSLALAALAGAALAIARAKDATVRLAVWTAVLYASLAMPFLARLAPTVPLPIPAFFRARPARPSARITMRGLVTGSPVQVVDAAKPFTLSPVRAAGGQPQGLPLRPAIPWRFAAAALYLLVAAVLLVRLAVGWYFSRRLILLSTPIRDGEGLRFLIEQSRRWGLRTAPGLAESPAVAVPVTLGWQRPLILLPLAWRGWREEKTQAVLAHELSHVVRKDTRTLAVAAMHRSIFWFNPLAWWLERHLAVLAEQASDDAALRAGADRVFYAEVLLDFFQDLRRAAGRVRWEGVAMTHGKQAHARVDRILDSTRKLSAGLRKPAWALLALLAVPVIYVLAGVRPVVAHKLHADDAEAVAASMFPLADLREADFQGTPAGPGTPAAPPPPAVPKSAPSPVNPPQAPSPPPAKTKESNDPESDEDVMILYEKSMSGTGTFRVGDEEHLRALRRASSGDIVWFRREGKAYIIRDPATVQRAKALWEAPNTLLNIQMAGLERRMEKLTSRQDELHKQFEQVRVPVPDLTQDLKNMQTRLEQLHKNGASQEELGELQGSLRELQGKLSELQDEAGGEMGAVGGKQGELGAQQEALGERQYDMAQQQAHELKEIHRKLKTMLDDALAKGLAQPE